MTRQELADKVWSASREEINDHKRYCSSGYHITERMSKDTMIETAFGFTDLGIPEWVEVKHEETCAWVLGGRKTAFSFQESDECDCKGFEEARERYYKDAEDPEVIWHLVKRLMKITPEWLRPEAEITLADVQEWWKVFSK